MILHSHLNFKTQKKSVLDNYQKHIFIDYYFKQTKKHTKHKNHWFKQIRGQFKQENFNSQSYVDVVYQKGITNELHTLQTSTTVWHDSLSPL